MEQKASPGYTVVIVEDDRYMRSILNHYLDSKFAVTAFDNGMDTLKYLQEGNIPDIIITDLNTPKLSGMELLEQIKASGFFKSIPVMILSGEDSTEKRIKCLNAGADDYVVKPFNPAELMARINVILRRFGKTVSF
ncbi:MAG TPA: response regulator transcription factor [Chitinophagaceae bacterium]|jgi:DNA-binding response OmpR family regulator|nr:response regulator transcription factor [Chitinophagaceae bacterium]